MFDSLRECHGLIVGSTRESMYLLDPSFGPLNQQLVLTSVFPLAGWQPASESVAELDERYAPYALLSEEDIEAQLAQFEAIRSR